MPIPLSRWTVYLPLAVGVLLTACSRADLQHGSKTTPQLSEAISATDAIGMPMPAPVMASEPQAMRHNMQANMIGMMPPMPYPAAEPSREQYQKTQENAVKSTQADAISTLSLDVDTGSYTNVRRMINQGQLPPADAVRIEEFLNYFRYQDPAPRGPHPFSVNTELATSPWTANNLLLRIGVKAVDVKAADQPPANLVFLVDVSGSMNDPEKLPLAQASLKLLTQRLRPQDRVSMVVYAGRTAVELPSTTGDHKAEILAAIDRLTAGGSTNGEAALKLAYQQAEAHKIKGGINRILLMTDGDFNVGVSNLDDIKAMIAQAREGGISLSTLGFGQGNYNEALMEQVADVGNGNYSYIDGLDEAKKVLSDELSATFNTVAKDVKLQLEFNPAVIQEWRLIGYENRVLNEQDFKNDKIDAAEVGAGKSVVALYELTPVGQTGLLAERRYGDAKKAKATKTDELGFLKVRYKQPNGQTSIELSVPIAAQMVARPSTDMSFAAAVAGYGQLLKNSAYTGQWSYAKSAMLAKQSLGKDTEGYRQGFVKLVELTDALAQSRQVQPNLVLPTAQ